MTIRTRFLFVLLVALAFSRPARAQTAYAPGGLFVHPTAYTPKRDSFSMYAAGFNQREDAGMQDNYIPISFTYSPTNRLAVSALGIYHDGFDHPRHIHLGSFIKYQLTPDSATRPAIAITGAYVGHDHLEEALAGVVSHAFVSRQHVYFIAHTGVKWGQTAESGHPNDFGAFTGLEVPLNRQFRLVGEYSTRLKFDRAPASSIGIMWRAQNGSGITVGVANTGRSSSMGFFFGVGLSLGGRN